MKAIICNNYGSVDDLVYGDMPDPKPSAHEIVIKAEAVGVNFPDALLIQGLYQAKPATPFVPGMEVVGRVEAVGEKVTRIKVGDKVAAISQIGAWSELVCCNEATVMPVPSESDSDAILALMCGFGTSHHGLKQRAQLRAGETLVVTGASGLTGLAAVQIGKAMGAKVIGVASTYDKQQIAKENGADHVLGYDNLKDEIKSLTKGKGADVVFDVVGGDVFDACSRAMAWEGRLLVVGFASGTIPKFPINLALVKGYSVVGVFWGSFTAKQPKEYAANMGELMQWYAQAKVAPLIGKTFTMENASSALRHIIDRKAIGKIVLKP